MYDDFQTGNPNPNSRLVKSFISYFFAFAVKEMRKLFELIWSGIHHILMYSWIWCHDFDLYRWNYKKLFECLHNKCVFLRSMYICKYNTMEALQVFLLVFCHNEDKYCSSTKWEVKFHFVPYIELYRTHCLRWMWIS